jgi:hypothetical protein
MSESIVSEGGHYYIDFQGDKNLQMWNNFVTYLDSTMPYHDIKWIDETLMSEFNAKWLRSDKRNLFKFYSAQELEYFLLRFS